MKRATNLTELANNLYPGDYLKEDTKEFYIPIFDHILQSIRQQIYITESRQTNTFYVSGQSGTGKTTALNFLADEKLSSKYIVKHIYGREIFDLNDVDIIDILLSFSFELIGTNAGLQAKYFAGLDQIQKQNEGSMDVEKTSQQSESMGAGGEAKASAKFGFLSFITMGLNVFASYKMDKEFRTFVREKFVIKKKLLLDLTNRIIDDFYEIFGTEKKLLIIFDDLEKMRDARQIRSLFIDNLNYFNQIRCKKIIVFPIHLSSDSQFYSENSNPEYFGLRLKENPHTPEKIDGSKHDIKKNRQLLHEVIRMRIKEGCELIDNEAIDLAISFSGGLIKQFLKLLYVAVIKASMYGGSVSKVTSNDVRNAVSEETDNMSRAVISTNRINMLNTIRQENKPSTDNDELFINALISNQVIVYQNGVPWYDVNPIITDTVKKYSK
jgi:hypothetical protein